MKHVLPRFINPRKPAGREEETKIGCETNTGGGGGFVPHHHTGGDGGHVNDHKGPDPNLKTDF